MTRSWGPHFDVKMSTLTLAGEWEFWRRSAWVFYRDVNFQQTISVGPGWKLRVIVLVSIWRGLVAAGGPTTDRKACFTNAVHTALLIHAMKVWHKMWLKFVRNAWNCPSVFWSEWSLANKPTSSFFTHTTAPS